MDRFLPKNIPRERLLAFGLFGAFGLLVAKKYFNGGICNIKKDLTGKVVVITGANTGIGKETARELARLNATIVLASRDQKKSLEALEEIKADTKNQNIEFIQLDLSDLQSIKRFADTFKAKYNRLDILINNAGVMALPNRKTTKDGFEMQFGTNHLGHFYLTELLTDLIKKSAPSRIINVSSNGHLMGKINWEDINSEKEYSPWQAYFQSKLANVLFSKELQLRFNREGIDVKAVSLHPGAVRTELSRYMAEDWKMKAMMLAITPLFYFMGKNSLQGAQTTLQCALEDQNKLIGGEYYTDCKIAPANPLALKEENAPRLWRLSEELLASKLNNQ